MHIPQTRRSDDKINWQQFSTPMYYALAAGLAAQIRKDDLVLEPSAGTGMLTLLPTLMGVKLALNEMEPTRHACLQVMYPELKVTRHNAEYLDDLLDDSIHPSVVLMNPPFSASPNMLGRRTSSITEMHITQALKRLSFGGRLVAITGHNFEPSNDCPIQRLQHFGKVVFTVVVKGNCYNSHGTNFDTRLTVIDKILVSNPQDVSVYNQFDPVTDLGQLADLVMDKTPPRSELKTIQQPFQQPVQQVLEDLSALEDIEYSDYELPHLEEKPKTSIQEKYKESGFVSLTLDDLLTKTTGGQALLAGVKNSLTKRDSQSAPQATAPHQMKSQEAVPVVYEPTPAHNLDADLSDGLYEIYRTQSVLIETAEPHPTPLVQSTAMASVAPPKPSYVPWIPSWILNEGVLSEAQIESLIYAGEAHSKHLEGTYHIDERHEFASSASPNPESIRKVRFRKGWFLGDGTGCGKGRQVAGVILDNWMQGRTKAIWMSKNDKLLEDARRDWEALGGSPSDVVPISNFKQGSQITLETGILFVTYGTLRTQANTTNPNRVKASRLDQIIQWAGHDFDGALVFDESHSLANCIEVKTKEGRAKPASKQGEAGLKIQHGLPDARVMYVSATGATSVEHLAYAERLGLWGEGTEFPALSDFISQIDAGGIAAMEVVSRDLKSLGLYTARSLSYEGIVVDILEHNLTPEQIDIYNTYCAAYQSINSTIEAALLMTNMKSTDGKLLNRSANTAKSVFESMKQRFFNHLLTAMKCQSVIPAMQADLEAGHAVIVHIVSTGEALLNKRLSEIPTEDWGDIHIDVTPREYILDYLSDAFPVQLHELRTKESGSVFSSPVYDENGMPVLNKDAVAKRDTLIEKIMCLPALPSALDQIVQHFGTDKVAEITGRKLRLVSTDNKVSVNQRPGTANTAETQAFMNDEKPILIFSNAGGTGRSYHADLGCKNQRQRIHYLLEAGWQADNAIQGLGRSNRTNQAHPPIFRPVATNVKGEKRFLSTIARRLDTLGAITKGQRQTGGQGMFRPEDNLESVAARTAIVRLLRLIKQDKVEGCSLREFLEQTGLSLSNDAGETLPPTSTLMNRILALNITTQNALFEAYEAILEDVIEGLKTAGCYDVGVETIQAKSLRVLETQTLYTHMFSGAVTNSVEIERTDEIEITNPDLIRAQYRQDAVLMVNSQSERAAICVPSTHRITEDGAVQTCVTLIRPTSRIKVTTKDLEKSNWSRVSQDVFKTVWAKELQTTERNQTSRFFLITGLLLPVWRKLNAGQETSISVRRLKTDDGQVLLGRIVSEADLPQIHNNLGLGAISVSSESLWAAINEGNATPSLKGGLRVVRRRVAGEFRIAVDHNNGPEMFMHLKTIGCFIETHQFSRVAFIPFGDRGQPIFKSLLESYPVESETDSPEADCSSSHQSLPVVA